MKYKLLLLDLDGTTVASSGDARPSQRVKEAVNKAQDYLVVALATGRPFALAKPVIEEIGLQGPAVFNGGAEIVDMGSGKVLYRQLLEVPTLQELVRLALPFNYNLYSDSDQYGKPITDANKITEPAAKILVENVSTKDVGDILNQLNSVAGVSAHSTTSWGSGDVVDIHVTHELATKRHGVEKLIEMLGLSKAEVIAVGDGFNDMPMLEAAGRKVAMGNAPDEVKKVVDWVAPSLTEDGVAVTIEKFILN